MTNIKDLLNRYIPIRDSILKYSDYCSIISLQGAGVIKLVKNEIKALKDSVSITNILFDHVEESDIARVYARQSIEEMFKAKTLNLWGKDLLYFIYKSNSSNEIKLNITINSNYDDYVYSMVCNYLEELDYYPATYPANEFDSACYTIFTKDIDDKSTILLYIWDFLPSYYSAQAGETRRVRDWTLFASYDKSIYLTNIIYKTRFKIGDTETKSNEYLIQDNKSQLVRIIHQDVIENFGREINSTLSVDIEHWCKSNILTGKLLM